MQVLLANLNVYSLSPEPLVSLSQKVKNGERLGVHGNFSFLNFFFDNRDAACSIRVPGIGLSQLDPRNISALAFCYPILKDIGEGDMPKHNPAVTAHGKHGRTAEFFL